MIGRIARIPMHSHFSELWIACKKILRQTSVADETSTLGCNVLAAVQKIRQLADAAVCNECSSGRVCAQCGRSCHRAAVDYTGTRNIEAPQHLIEQRRVASRAGRVERIQEAIPENIHSIDWKCIPKLRTFTRDICRAQRYATGQFALNLKIEVLNIWAYAMIASPLHNVVARAVDRNRLERCELLRYGQRNVRQR